MSTTCPKCGYKNPDETAFCGKCGTKFDAKIDHTKTLKSLGIEKLIADKYQLLEELGRGGMGIVYKANDVKLDRTVALKFLPPGVSHDKEAKKRFIQEAKAASGLDHTNICTIYEIGDPEDEQMFIAMPYYEGESIRKKFRGFEIFKEKDGKRGSLYLASQEPVSKTEEFQKEVDFIAEHTDKCDFAFIMAMADEGETCRDTILEKLRPTVMLQKGICFFI